MPSAFRAALSSLRSWRERGATYTSQPRIGFTARLPSMSAVFSQASTSFIMPNMLPWSVTATAGMPSSWHFLPGRGCG